jgi:hypothetical protein
MMWKPVGASLLASYLEPTEFGRLAMVCLSVHYSGQFSVAILDMQVCRRYYYYGEDSSSDVRLLERDHHGNANKALVQRVVRLKVFARQPQKELDAHCCYGPVAAFHDDRRELCRRMSGSCPLEDTSPAPLLSPHEYDFFVRFFRYDSGRELFEQFVPVCQDAIGSGRGGSPRPGVVKSCAGTRPLRDWNPAWVFTGAMVVAMAKKDDGDGNRALLVASGFCLPPFRNDDDGMCIQPVDYADFGDTAQPSGDLAEGDRVWYVCHYLDIPEIDLECIVNGHNIRAIRLTVIHDRAGEKEL